MNSSFLKTGFIRHALLFTALAIVPETFAQTLTIITGNGQLVGPTNLANKPLTVQLLDATGTPIANQVVSFTATSSFAGNPTTPTAITDATGTASSYFIGATLQGTGNAYVSNTVVAQTGNLSVLFYETTTGALASGGNLVTSTVLSPAQGTSLSGAAGSASTTPIQVRVQATTNVGAISPGVANVSLAVVIDPGSTGNFTCKEGTNILTDGTGTATCTPVFGKVGSGTYTITVGGSTTFFSQPFQVSVGPPGLITINGGSNQMGSPGSTLPLPLVATVADLGGNPISGVAVTFTSLTPGGATFTNVRSTSDDSGKVSANAILGNVPGVIQIIVRDVNGLILSPAVFSETVNLTITGLQKSSGDLQSAIINTPFSQPLVVQLSAANNQSPQGTPVQFTVTSGSASVATSTVSADANGFASTIVNAGGTVGPVTVTASSGSYSTTFSLTVAPPGPSNLSFTNNASGVVNNLSPGSIVTIYGSGIAPTVQGVVGSVEVGPLPYQVAGVTVKFGSVFAPIYGVGNSSGSQFVTVQVPFETAVGPSLVTVAVSGGGSATVQANVAQASPGIFEYIATDNSKNAVALRPDGSVVSPSNPAARGENLRFYVTGAGPLTPNVATNGLSPLGSDATVVYPIVLGIANDGVPTIQSIYARNLIGIEEITFNLPSSTATGRVQISIGVVSPSATAYSQGSFIYVQ